MATLPIEQPTPTNQQELEKEAEEFIGELEDIDEKDRLSLTSPPPDPSQWALFSSMQEATEWFGGRINNARSRWFGYQIQDPIRVIVAEKDVVLIQGVPYYTHTCTEHVFPYTNVPALDHPHKHKLNIYLPAKVAIKPPTGNGVTLKNYDEVMALYMQDVSNLNLPVVIHIHGGGWQRGDRSTIFYGAPYMGAGYARKGFVSVTVSYRLATKSVQHPAQIEDVARAIRWIHNHAHQFGGDKTKIFVSGHSAGAHLAALITAQPLYLKNLGLDNVIKGAILVSGIYDLSKAVSNSEKPTWRESIFQRAYVIPTFGIDPKVWLDASPYNIVSSQNPIPPILLINAASDLGLENGAKRFFEKLQQLGAAVTAHVVPCTTHKTISQNSKTLELATEFIQKILQTL